MTQSIASFLRAEARRKDAERRYISESASAVPDPFAELEARLLLHDLAARLSGKVYRADSEQRKYLHLAAVFACNFTNHLYALCDRILQEHNLPFEAMLPLIRETAAKVADMSPFDAQTGPAIRYDQNIIAKQEALLTDPTMREIYTLLSRSIHETHNPDKPKES